MNLFEQWESVLPQYPKWCYGGAEIILEESGDDGEGHPIYALIVKGVGENEVDQYSQLVKQHGFRTAGKRPNESQLYKRVDGVVYNFSSEQAFDGDHVRLDFQVREPNGGFDYKK